MMNFGCQIVAARGSDRPEILILCGFQNCGAYSHSSSPNAFCIISVRHRPGGRSESLWSSYSTASTASGYHFVIRVITGGWLLWRISLFRGDIILQRTRYSKRAAAGGRSRFSSAALSDWTGMVLTSWRRCHMSDQVLSIQIRTAVASFPSAHL